jgi:ABC-type amino acid transport substrate-binding protein
LEGAGVACWRWRCWWPWWGPAAAAANRPTPARRAAAPSSRGWSPTGCRRKHLKWGAQLNTTGADYLAHTIKPTTETRLFDRTVDTFTALNAGQIQAVLLDTPIVLGAVKEQRVREGKVVGQFKTGEQYGAVVNRNSPNLDAFNQVITTLKSEGFVDRLPQTYVKDQVSVPVIG